MSCFLQSLYDDGAEAARRQLLSGCQLLQVASDGCIDRLLAVWQGAVRHIYSYYQLSAKAYFTYVRLSAQVSVLGVGGGGVVCVGAWGDGGGAYDTSTPTTNCQQRLTSHTSDSARI